MFILHQQYAFKEISNNLIRTPT